MHVANPTDFTRRARIEAPAAQDGSRHEAIAAERCAPAQRSAHATDSNAERDLCPEFAGSRREVARQTRF